MDSQSFSASDYREIVERTQRGLDALIFEIEHDLVNNLSKKIDRDFRFEVVPLLRRLKEARAESNRALLFLN